MIVELNKANKKIKLFQTCDKVDIFEGDIYWHCVPLNEDFFNCEKIFDVSMAQHVASKKGILYTNPSFSTKEKAEEYRNNLLLEEAKKRYPIGTKVKSVNTGNFHTVERGFFTIWKGVEIYVEMVCIYNNGKWAEIVKEEKTLIEYESSLLSDYKNIVSSHISISRGQFFEWMKLTEPKLYWTAVLSLIAKSINGENWKPVEKDNKYCIQHNIIYRAVFSEFSLSGLVYFKTRESAEKAIKLMGDKLDYIYK